MSALLKEIQASAVDANQPVANVLRKFAVLASRLKNDELSGWAFKELNGYSRDDELPGYRVLAARASVNLAGPFGSGYNNITVPAGLLPKELRDYGEVVRLRQPIASLEELAAKAQGRGEITYPWPGDLTAIMQDKFNGHVVIGGWQSTSASSLTGIVDTVRNRILEFSLKLENELPTAGEENSQANAAAAQTASQLYQTIIFGNNTGNVANASPGTVQTISIVNKGDLKALIDALVQHGVPADDVRELESLINEEGSAHGMGPKAGAWLAKATSAVASRAWKLASGVGIPIITKLVLSFYGINL